MLPPLEALRTAWLLLRRPLEVSRPRHLQVLITDRCNLACAGCARNDPLYRPTNRNMPLASFERLLERLRPREVTLLGEGDPLLHSGLADFVRAARAAHARVHLASNLSVGKAGDLTALVEAGLDTLRVQIAHSASERYREIKGRDLFPAVLERLDLLTAEVSSRRGRGPTIVLEFWIELEALDDLEAHLNMARTHGVRRVHFLPRHGADHRGPLRVVPAHLASLRRARERERALGLRSNLSELCARAEAALAARRPAREAEAASARASCALPWLRAYVDLGGRMGPCADLVTKARSHPELDLPHALTEEDPLPYAGAWMRRLRASFKRGQAPHAICANCSKGRLSTLWGAARLRAPLTGRP